MIKDKYEMGERVTSIVYGFHKGEPGTILKEADMQYGNSIRYLVQLDSDLVLTLPAKYIETLEEESDKE